MALAFLLLVLVASSRNGRVVGLILAVLSFLSFNFFLLAPYYTLAIEDPLDWWVLVAFLITGSVAAQLFHRTQTALSTAERRTREMERLAALGAQSLSVPRAADAVQAICRVIGTELPVAAVEIWMFRGSTEDAVKMATHPEGPAQDSPTNPARSGSRRQFEIPLKVRERGLGVLRLFDPEGVRLDPAQARFTDTLAYFAALALERVHLAERAARVEKLQEADRMKDAFLASVSHDFRTPLTTIRALATELGGVDEERSRIIAEEADRLNRMVQDLLDMSRIRSGSLPLDIEVNTGEDVIGAVLQRVGGISGCQRIHVEMPADGGLPIGRFDFVHTLRALGNLVENALLHAGTEEPVTVRVFEEEDALVFTVLDRGPGVPEARSALIFEPFFHSGSSREEPGTGLGLAIARSLAEAQGGAVSFRPRPGGGSVFELRLPGGRE